MKGVNKKTSASMLFGSGASSAKSYKDLSILVEETIKVGIRGFDTAPSYGTEEVLAKAIKYGMSCVGLQRSDVFIQSKIDIWQMIESKGKITPYFIQTLKKMNLDYLDSLLIHWPYDEFLIPTWECMQQLKENRLVRQIGICNLNHRKLTNFSEQGINPQIIQIERNPLRTCDKEEEYCHNKNIEIQAYSPLCKMDERLKNSDVIKRIAEKYEKNVGQVIMRWHLDTGVTPVFTSTKTSRIREYTKIDDFCLSAKEILLISQLNQNYKMYLESLLCPGY